MVEKYWTTLHGLKIRSEVPLSAPRAEHDLNAIDVDFVVGRPPSSWVEGNGEVMARFADVGANRRHTLTSHPSGWRLEFGGAARLWIARHGPTVIVAAEPDVPVGLLSVLLSGPATTAICLIRGFGMFHASAVLAPEGAIAFAGPPGCGKSTLAALSISSGFSLFSDDTVRLDESVGGVVNAFRGTTFSRKRPREHAPLDAGALLSADGRMVASTAASLNPGPARLLAVFLPVLSPGFESVATRVVRAPEALVSLSSEQSFPGVVSASLIDRQFDLASRVVASVPVRYLAVPWGEDGGDAGLGSSLRALLRATILGGT